MNNEQRRTFRRIGHALKPVVMLGNNGVSDGVIEEVNRALLDHELIKIKVIGDDRHERAEIIEQIVNATASELVQSVGKMALIYKKNPKANPRLSNIARHGA